MSTLFYQLKGLFSVLNFLLFILLLAFIVARYQKKNLSVKLVITALAIFLLCSTAYLPQYLAQQLEKKYTVFDPLSLKGNNQKIYIHVLGSGYGLDKRLPATAKLGLVQQGRLAEAIRIYRQLDSSVIVCSGNSLVGLESQAAIEKKAAILLGVDSSRIITLDMPGTTQEEAIALKNSIGTKASMIIVTDAIHMPRAYKFFSQQGFLPIAAPTNFKVLESENDLQIKWWPRIDNISLTDMVLHEYLGNLKAAL